MFITTTSDTSTSGEGGENQEANPMQRKENARARTMPLSLRNAPRCQARSRSSGRLCRSPAVSGKRTCRMHGSARGSGAPKGEANGAWKHGGFTAEAVELRRNVTRLLRMIREDGDVGR